MDPATVRSLVDATGLPAVAARILAVRGYTDPDEIRTFLSPTLRRLSDPFALPGTEQAAHRIALALERQETIVVFGDYDADGVTAAALLIRVLRALGGRAEPFLPCRFRDGYGLTPSALMRCLERFSPRLLVTVDCGITAAAEVSAARRAGVDVIVTDHHAPGPVRPAAEIVHPAHAKDPAVHPLAGVGVAFKLAHALLKHRRAAGDVQAHRVDLRRWLDLVAVGTVGDVAPLCGENRILVRYGLGCLNTTPCAGLAALRDRGRFRPPLQAWHLAYGLAPRLNAAGRMQDAHAAVSLLLSDDPATAIRLAGELEAHNAARRTEEHSVLQEALRDLEARSAPDRDFGLVVAGSGWHEGILGIVAARLAERYGRPAVVVTLLEQGPARGSARSGAGVNLLQVLEACRPALLTFGGHAAAAGLCLDPSAVPEFAHRFQDACAEQLRGRDLRPVMNIDAWVELKELDEKLWEALCAMEPFGVGHPEPVLAVHRVRLTDAPRVVGGNHLRMVLQADDGLRLDAIGFRMADNEIPEGPLDVAFHLSVDDYRTPPAFQARIRALRPTTEPVFPA